jgi:hypothetical protein
MTRVSSVRSKEHVISYITFCINRWGWVSELLWHSVSTVVFMSMSWTVCLYISRLPKMFDSAYSYFAELLYSLSPNLQINSLSRETVNITFQRIDTTHRDSFIVVRPFLFNVMFVVGE